MEIRRFGIGHRRLDGPPGTRGAEATPVHVDERGVVAELALKPNASIAPHTNPSLAYFLVIEGGGFVRVGDEQARVAAGEAVVWPPNVVHSAWTELTPMRAIIVEFATRPAEPLSSIPALPTRPPTRPKSRPKSRPRTRLGSTTASFPSPPSCPRTASRPIRSPGSLLGLRRRAPWPPAAQGLRDRRLVPVDGDFLVPVGHVDGDRELHAGSNRNNLRQRHAMTEDGGEGRLTGNADLDGEEPHRVVET